MPMVEAPQIPGISCSVLERQLGGGIKNLRKSLASNALAEIPHFRAVSKQVSITRSVWLKVGSTTCPQTGCDSSISVIVSTAFTTNINISVSKHDIISWTTLLRISRRYDCS